MSLINVDEIKELVNGIPLIARGHPSVKLLVAFVGKVIGGLNTLDKHFKDHVKASTSRLEALEKAAGIVYVPPEAKTTEVKATKSE